MESLRVKHCPVLQPGNCSRDVRPASPGMSQDPGSRVYQAGPASAVSRLSGGREEGYPQTPHCVSLVRHVSGHESLVYDISDVRVSVHRRGPHCARAGAGTLLEHFHTSSGDSVLSAVSNCIGVKPPPPLDIFFWIFRHYQSLVEEVLPCH